jgi:sodium/bile acid cotransporter 7
MLVAVGLALVAPNVGAKGGLIPFGAITQLGIAIVFFLHGANLSPSALRAGAANWRLHVFIHATTFVMFPALGFLIYRLSGSALPPDMRLGVFYLAALCSTISSSVAMVAIARGNLAAAVFDATLSGLIGMVLTPILMSLVVPHGAGHLPVLQSIGDVALKLLAPFAAGHLLRPFLVPRLASRKSWITKLDRGVIVLIVYTAFCDSTAAGVWSRYGFEPLVTVAVVVAALLACALVTTTLVSRSLGFSREDEITAVFCGSKKSLANGAPIANTLFAGSPSMGAILLPLMIYHQLQLIVCSILARRYAERMVEAVPTA